MTFSDDCTQLTCPHCGEPKYLLALASGNTFEGEIWSDSRQWYPMLLTPSSIQKCPHCSHYFFYDDGNPKEIVMEVWENAWVTWRLFRNGSREKQPERSPEQLAQLEKEQKIQDDARKNRFGDLAYKEIEEAKNDLIDENCTEEHRKRYLLSFLFAYNDAQYGRAHSKKEDIPEYYQERFREVAKDLIDLFGEEKTLTAELWRELGNFEKSIELCQSLIENGKDVGVVKQILERAQNQDSDAFILHFDKDG